MNNNNPTIGALILLPVAIAFCAAFLALKTAGLFKHIYHFLNPHWIYLRHWLVKKRSKEARKIRRSNVRTHRIYGDSWIDLESFSSRHNQYDKFIGQTADKTSRDRSSISDWGREDIPVSEPAKVWHPSRSTRMTWSFTNPRSPSLSHLGLSNVARLSPATRPTERHMEDATRLARQGKVRAARPSVLTDL
jgi:hypothetical protein